MISVHYEAQNAEMQVYVQAETAPLHAGIAQLSADFKMVAVSSVEHDDRIEQLEQQLRIMRSQLGGSHERRQIWQGQQTRSWFYKDRFSGFPEQPFARAMHPRNAEICRI